MYSRLATAVLSILLFTAPLHAEVDHREFLSGTIVSGEEATRQCLGCHQEQAAEIMKTTHWTWSSEQKVAGNGKVDLGKKNAINNFCVSVNANWPRCTSCHIGYGWKDANFDFADAGKVDCLVCHDTTGTYQKDPAAAGQPAEGVNLLFVAQQVGKPSRATCGACHFFGGGGDAVKHGDLDSSMLNPSRQLDVHMAADGNNFQCQNCHATSEHKISGRAMVVSPGGDDHIGCEKCHDAAPHKDSLLNRHFAAVACQTCHIPAFAREMPTKTSWDWSTAGQERVVPKDQYGRPTYDQKKGDFTWGKNIIPTYRWYNGHAGAYLVGDKMNPQKVTELSYPEGNIKDGSAKIYPFKVHTGKQIYDKKYNYFITPQVFGKEGYWKTFDWNRAAQIGMKASGLAYSGDYGFAPTIMYWRINHMVAPKEQALGCLECHGDKGRLDWRALGYKGDPIATRQTVRMGRK
jgi:octaheme c-type cytochrome (tetrathionate reductase family)